MGGERRIHGDDRRGQARHRLPRGGPCGGRRLHPGADPVHKVTIIPRGRALGVTWQLPERDRYSSTREYMEGQIAIMMGGRIAEELFFNRLSTGASNDIERATSTARHMVCDYGMSDKLGPLSYGQGEHEIFLGRDISQRRDFSEDTARIIDAEVHAIVMRNYQRAKSIIEEKRDKLVAIAESLLVRETLDGRDVDLLMNGRHPAPQGASQRSLGPRHRLGH